MSINVKNNHLKCSAQIPIPAPFDPPCVERVGGHDSSVMHSCPAPSPPFWLLVTQTVFFSSLDWEFSEAELFSAHSTDSDTLISPAMLKTLFFVPEESAACSDSAHSQQLLWQMEVYAVSGVEAKYSEFKASTLCSYPEANPADRPGSSLHSHGHSGRATLPPPCSSPPSDPFWARFLA